MLLSYNEAVLQKNLFKEHLFSIHDIYKKSVIAKSCFKVVIRECNSRIKTLQHILEWKWTFAVLLIMLIMPSFVFLTIRMFHAVNANANDENVRTEMFKTKGNTRVLLTENTTYVYSRSVISFANKCLSDPYCCLASYSKETSTCRIDSSRSCCTETEHQRDGGIFDESLIIIVSLNIYVLQWYACMWIC